MKYTIEKRRITKDKIKILIIKPKNKKSKDQTPGVLWIHGGGYLYGFSEMVFFSRGIDLVKKHNAVVISVEYRKAPKYPYPTPLNDCYEALKYLKEHHEELGFNPNQIFVGGESAGGGLTCALCILARDKKEVNIAYQMPIYPMIDCYDTKSNLNKKAKIWKVKHNKSAWKKYLGNLSTVPSYASPSRLEDFDNLPPMYSFIGSNDLFYDETISYQNKLKEVNITAKVDIYDNCYHAFDMLFPFKKMSKLAIKKFNEEFVFACNNYYKEQDNKKE